MVRTVRFISPRIIPPIRLGMDGDGDRADGGAGFAVTLEHPLRAGGGGGQRQTGLE